MVHWYFDEKVVAERMRETQRHADRAQALGLHGRVEPSGWQRLRIRLGEQLIAVGRYLQQTEVSRRPGLVSSSQCGLR